MPISYRFSLNNQNASYITSFFPAIHLSPYKKYAIALVSFAYVDQIQWSNSTNPQQDPTIVHPLTPPSSPPHEKKNENSPGSLPLPSAPSSQILEKVGESLRKEEYYAPVSQESEPDPCEGKEIFTNEDGTEYCQADNVETPSKKSKRETGTPQKPSMLMKSINIKCDLISAHCYKNDTNTRILYSFVALTSNSGKLIKIEPKNLIYLPLTANKEKSDRDIVISSIGIQIQDLNKKPINFQHPYELILHLKEIQ